MDKCPKCGCEEMDFCGAYADDHGFFHTYRCNQCNHEIDILSEVED